MKVPFMSIKLRRDWRKVIPREGVESKTIAKAKSVRAEGIVIPREGVESAGAFAGKLNFTRASDPERGS